MELCAVLLWALVSGVYGIALENVDLGPCMSECPGTGQLAFQKGYRYIYSYSAVTETFLQGTSSDKSLLTLDCIIQIEVVGKCHMLLKIQNAHLKANMTSKQGSQKEFIELRDNLEKHPLQFSYHDGKIQRICPVREEKTWALNVKRGILSVLQGNLKTPSAGRTIEEIDVLGKCPTTYEFRGQSVWKKKDLTHCSNRILGSTSLRSVPLPGKTQILDSNLECMQNFRGGVLAEATCNESHLVTLFSREGNGAKTKTQSVLKLQKTEVDIISNKVLPARVYVTSLMYEKETSPAKPGGEDAAETVRSLCQSSHLNYETTDLFIGLVFELRLLSSDALSELWQRSSFKCRDNWQPLLDALPSCGTEACVGLMKEILLSKELEDEKMESFLWSLAFIAEPTSGMIGSLTMQGVLKAIGNAGLAASLLIPTLNWCALIKTNPESTRLAAVDAFRRIPCSANRDTLSQLYEDLEETVEIRIAAYYTAMKCPSQELLHLVRETLRYETSTQVGSFVWSHLSQLLESDDPLKQAIADTLPDDILSKDFEGESWKYSTYSDATVHSESVGANLEASLIFTPSSFIPRSAMANFTMHTLGRAVNIMELGIRLENAEDLLKSMLGRHSSTLNEILVEKDEEDKKFSSEPPIETVTSPTDKKPTSKRYNPGELNEKKSDQQKVKKSKHSCPSGKYNKLNELQQKFTQGKSDKKELRCGLSMKIFGNELIFLDYEGVRDTVKQHSLSLAGLAVKLLKGQEVHYTRRLTLAADSVIFPAISGFPVQLAINASASTSIKIRGNMDLKQQTNFFINGYIKPSASLQLSAHMGITGAVGKIGLKWVTGIKTMSSLDGGIHMRRGQDLKVFLNTHEESMEILDYSSQLYLMTSDVLEKIKSPRGQAERKSCMNEDASKLLGWQPCFELSFPDGKNLLPFPWSGPGKASLVLKKHDKGLQQYLLEASYNQVSQKDGWLPYEATMHFFLGTPKSEIKRDVGIDLYYNIPHRKFRLKLLHPKKKVQMDGRIESSRNSRNGHLELIVDDKEIYYIKGMTDLQTVGGEQRYSAVAELKLSRHGSPIVLAGNITKQLGKKMAFSASLNNLLKDTAFITVLIDKKADDKMKQYSLESEAYVPGVFGSHGIGLLQKRGSVWSTAMRVKYGLLGDAKFLRHECDTGQKIKIDTDSEEQYTADFEHEFHCTQIQTLNHKVHLHHEEFAPHIHSYLEVSYGKHWDEMNNKKKLFISQTFKNNSNPSSSSYFMEILYKLVKKGQN
ncbi:vitellogenin [Bufo gargarizans]|uniref:vitellogenin n=1 Tax=Bufo gargarizans TaxID=30331 RepID=UPI001CF55EB1|nr:vitellogenin [Bufo gargarizans]